MKTIDINCDMGEGGDFDDQIMSLISSCNIACGGHAGNDLTIAKTVELAIKNKVHIGAHPSYPDLENFGRKAFDIGPEQLKNTLKEQIHKIQTETKKQSARLYHIKPHGALYNELKTDTQKAQIVIEVIEEIDSELILFVPPKSIIMKLAKDRLHLKVEGFADRNYEKDFSLTPRSFLNAVLHDEKEILNQVVNMAFNKKVNLNNGTVLHQQFDTICVHSDTKNSLAILEYLNIQLPKENIQIKA